MSSVDKYIYTNHYGPGIFVYQNVSAYIKSCIKNRINLDKRKFLNEMINQYKSSLEHFLPIISQEEGCSYLEAADMVEDRLMVAFYGIYGEAILENMFLKSWKYELMSLESSEDWESNVDLKIRDRSTGQIIYLQVKTISWLKYPKDWQQRKLDNEKETHERKNLDVEYAFYKHKFDERHFIFDDMKLDIYGYGNTNIKELEDIMVKVFEKFQYEVTAENLIF